MLTTQALDCSANYTQIIQMFQLEQNDIYLAGFYITCISSVLWRLSRQSLVQFQVSTSNNKQSPVYNKEVHWNLQQFLSIPQRFTLLPFGATEDKSVPKYSSRVDFRELYKASNTAKKYFCLLCK